MKKEKISTSGTDDKGNTLFTVKAEYVSSVWDMSGNRLRFVYKPEERLLTLLEGNKDNLYVLYGELYE
tara:strand:- start:593 stop:796 length:204 start_codon:yes stop_codon:yes gene_type:complete